MEQIQRAFSLRSLVVCVEFPILSLHLPLGKGDGVRYRPLHCGFEDILDIIMVSVLVKKYLK
jgi:hypothetical protein